MKYLILLILLIASQIHAVEWNFQTETKKVFAIGDIHGNLDTFKLLLEKMKLINNSGDWVGNDIVLVQVGDFLDKNDQDKEVLEYLQELQLTLPLFNSRIVILNGNHEIYNLAHTFKSVTNNGYMQFQSYYRSEQSYPQFVIDLPLHQRGRAVAFMPGGDIAKWLSHNPSVAIVGSTLFVHGGITFDIFEYGLERINTEIESWILGLSEMPEYALSKNGIFRTRYLSKKITDIKCLDIKQLLRDIGVDRVVVGHTPQKNGINSKCDNSVWNIDSSLSNENSGFLQAISINSNNVSIIK